MDRLSPYFRILPLVLTIYGFLATLAQMADIRRVWSSSAVDVEAIYQLRWLHFTQVVGGFDSLFFYSALAALVYGLNKRNGDN